MKVEQIFKVGDRVYDYRFGWGKITRLIDNVLYPIKVAFESDAFEYYTIEGSFFEGDKPALSFTEYTINGFSQVRPQPDIEKDTLVYVRNGLSDMRYFSYFEDGKVRCYLDQQKSGDTCHTAAWNEYSLTNPLQP